MKQGFFEITENTPLVSGVYRMRLRGDTSAFSSPGQFLNIRLDGLFLRRPLSVCDLDGDTVTVIYKTVGEGTRRLSAMKSGTLDLLTGLGNGYDLTVSGDAPLLVGGGVGVPPLYLAAKRLAAEGKKVSAVLGFNRADEVFYEKEFAALGAAVTVMTADGSYGGKGFVTDAPIFAVERGAGEAEAFPLYSYLYTCGPEPMLRAVYRKCRTGGQFSFEERMGCGFGACMGCSCKTVTGYKRICKEGPVLQKEEILWEK